MATIKAINDQSIHQIQSGQVIVDLCSVVKELVENSLDAGATSIDIRFKNHGLDSIEVQDNGAGISSADYETIALKHYTSKLSSYEDLSDLETFGFRGEALSSLCALSNFHITTAKAEAGPKATRLDFETSGKLKGTSVVAAQKGTTVSVEHLFKNLPVRRKELEKNIKREYAKVLNLLHAYACIGVGVRFSISNQVAKGKKVPAFSTRGNDSFRENIINVFGAKTSTALIKLDLHLEMQPNLGPTTQSARNWHTQDYEAVREVLIQGHISKPVFGEGRQTPDRQMFFVNSRPCLLPQIAKAINEVYKSFNVSQSPSVFANLIMDTNAYDVNVSPDKRTILLHDQPALLESLKSALSGLFEAQAQSVPASQLTAKKFPAFRPLNVVRQSSSKSLSPDSPQSPEAKQDDGSHSMSSIAGSPSDLIHHWIGRDADDRAEVPKVRGKPNARPDGPPKDKSRKVDTIPARRTSDIVMAAYETTREFQPDDTEELQTRQDADRTGILLEGTDGQQTHPLSSPFDDLLSQRPPGIARQVEDFNTRFKSQEINKAAGSQNGPTNDSQDSRDHKTADANEGDERISAITPGIAKSTPGPVQSAFDRMRPKRTPTQIAHITVGDQTMTTVIGTPESNKRRIYAPKDSQSIAKFEASPLLARSLRAFAAPGTQLAEEAEEAGETTEAEGIEKDEDIAEAEKAEDEELEEEEDSDPDRHEEAVTEEITHGYQAAELLSRYLTHTQDLQASGRPVMNTGQILDASMSDPDSRSHSGASESDDPINNKRAFVEAEDSDDEYLDEEDKRIREDEKVARMIQAAEETAARPSEENLKRASQFLKGYVTRKDATWKLIRPTDVSKSSVLQQAAQLYASSAIQQHVGLETSDNSGELKTDQLDASDAEMQLSLTITKSDFERMRVVGQFNLGFILALRPPSTPSGDIQASTDKAGDHLFIIDQHAADEKFNFERLTQTTQLTPQRLVQPKALQLSAVDEEIIFSNTITLEANGFQISIDESGSSPAGQRCQLLSLPTSKETTFTVSDLEELIHLLSEDYGTGSSTHGIVRPSRVRRMLAMRACRSSIMVGKTLTMSQMERVVGHMGEMEKPWNCPHGRPTMRHLAGLDGWTSWTEGKSGWLDEDDVLKGAGTDWAAYVQQ